MKKLLLSTLLAGLSAPLMAAPPGAVQPLDIHEQTHQGGFFREIVRTEEPKVDDSDKAAAVGNPAAEEGVASAGDAVAVPGENAPLSLSTPLYGDLTVGAAVGIGAAVVAVGAAIGNHGGGGHHGSSGTTGTTR
ncbi:hypothetical protein [Pseudomonas nitroreducens]|uniref:hypothetical protein n=1 Tax=Pseudomonas nitroreducens TaxID=46680 RepID=UPI0038169FAC